MIRRDELLKAIKMMKKYKAAGHTGIVSEMIMADEDCGMELLTSMYNLMVAQGTDPNETPRRQIPQDKTPHRQNPHATNRTATNPIYDKPPLQ